MYFLTCNYKFLNVHQTIKKFLSQTQTIGIYVSHLAQETALYNCVLNHLTTFCMLKCFHVTLYWFGIHLVPLGFETSRFESTGRPGAFRPESACSSCVCGFSQYTLAPTVQRYVCACINWQTELAIMPGLHLTADMDTNSWRPGS